MEKAAGFGVTAKVEWTMGSPGYSVPKDSAAVRLISAVFDQMGVTPLPEASGGGMDANIYNAKGMATVGVATGYTKNHTKNEQLVLEDFYKSGELAQTLIETFAARCESK